MKWTDTSEIAMQLADEHPDVDPRNVNFVDLRNWVVELPEFDDDPDRSGERILEAIQLAWMDEADVDD
ncbi:MULTISPECIES: Fe-S cluster assembly protein IscX [unclassified Thioalkalivibrio]|uniref:Fe-S cluster assembly protein IscX n=1 Tax=unclassified Thioalkalivibrio TaxID=2621013 RepID=UPI0003601330|nr:MULTISPECIES: Fe-S cluster assembly protein IscX [unclassified Thioalkalivibrio]